jgi:hypothetical protein
MTLPRFTSGKVGNLTFAHMNEIVDRLEAVEKKAADPNRDQRGVLLPFLAKTTLLKPQTNNLWGFTEFTYGKSRDIRFPAGVDGGRASGRANDPWAFPLIGEGLIENQLVLAFPMNDDEGKLVFHAVPSPVNSIVARVTGFESTVVGQWKYLMQAATITSISPTPLIVTGGATITAYNGCEWVTDGSGTYGVGMRPPSGTFLRQPIKVGTVAVISNDANGFWHFSIPNGYQVTCV